MTRRLGLSAARKICFSSSATKHFVFQKRCAPLFSSRQGRSWRGAHHHAFKNTLAANIAFFHSLPLSFMRAAIIHHHTKKITLRPCVFCTKQNRPKGRSAQKTALDIFGLKQALIILVYLMPYLLLNLSTRPPYRQASLPVKNGWHCKQISIFIFSLTEPV